MLRKAESIVLSSWNAPVSYADSLVMMSLTMVVAAGVAVNDGAIEEHRQHLLHGKLWSASMDADA